MTTREEWLDADDLRHEAYWEGVLVNRVREEARRIIEDAKGSKRLGGATEREHGYSKARGAS